MPLNHDLDLRPSDLQALASRDAIAAFFTNLGYDTNARLTQTSEAMGLTAESLRREIKHIERIADHEDGALQVYLLEIKSITVANVQALARGLRNRAGNFLWVLTSDYERLAFVLFEPTLPTKEASSGIGFRGAFLRPRILYVNRRAPANVDLRVLRRFSYTELDADYQFQKLQSAYNIADWSEPFFNNRALFSDYYLNQRLPETAEWHESPAQALRVFQEQLLNVRERAGGKPEQVARRVVIEPALHALGFNLTAGKAGAGDVAEPDYVLHAGDAARPLAYCNAYVWDRNLDGRDEQRDLDTPDENPGAVVVSLLDRADAPPWAIVTNGKTWRLYSARTHSRATNYYEIDLEEAANSLDPQLAFRYFWLFFRAQAFATTEGGSFLDRLMDESARYAKELGERLKDRVFEQIFPYFAEGFITHIRATEGAGVTLDQERLDTVYYGALTFLYRLLFLLYAEARDLLPVRDVGGYQEVSLQKLKTEVADNGGAILDAAPGKLQQAYDATATELYTRLNRLCMAVDAGDAALNVPLYNGGLFMTAPDAADSSPEARSARLLQAHAIPDRYLAQGLDRMARDLDPKTQALGAIDYKSLGVRQLGSIYEGLLEFKLRVAPEQMAVVKGKKTDEVIPLHEAETKKLKPKTLLATGAVYLENDRRERKATGSYYTPDYIVEYIVKHTAGPVLEAKCEALRPKLREAQRRHQEAVARQKAFQKSGMAGDDPEKVANSYRALVDELFDLRLVDPAMGSGHFLVEAVDFITDGMLNFLNGFRWNPITAELRRTRETIMTEMERQGVIIDPARLTDVNLLKRHVLKRCVYGVDLNPMAVELAKVSLWLDCFTVGAPLSFLDHHLKCGNSLIGARITEVREAIEFKQDEQIGLFASSEFTGIMLATDLMRQVGELSDVTAEQVRQSRTEYRRATGELAPFKRIMDVYLSRWFGNEPSKSQARLGLEPTVDFLRRPETKTWLDNPEDELRQLPREMQPVATTALKAADEKAFFHWELEFPEVFFARSGSGHQVVELRENGGFDAVVGNPPYGAAFSSTDKQYLTYAFDSFMLDFDSFIFFLEASFRLVRKGGLTSFIVPEVWLRLETNENLRRLVLSHLTLSSLWITGKTFEEVVVYTCVPVLKRKQPGLSDSTLVILADEINSFGSEPKYKMGQSAWINNEYARIEYLVSPRFEQVFVSSP